MIQCPIYIYELRFQMFLDTMDRYIGTTTTVTGKLAAQHLQQYRFDCVLDIVSKVYGNFSYIVSTVFSSPSPGISVFFFCPTLNAIHRNRIQPLFIYRYRYRHGIELVRYLTQVLMISSDIFDTFPSQVPHGVPCPSTL